MSEPTATRLSSVGCNALLAMPSVAISIRQPWAACITGGLKDVENRSWKTKYRGHVLIHAGKAKIDPYDMVGAEDIMKEHGLKIGTHDLDGNGKPTWELGRGGIVGVAEIVDCVTWLDSPWFFGPFGFVIRNARSLPFFPCKGALGFFRVEYPSELAGLANVRSEEPE